MYLEDAKVYVSPSGSSRLIKIVSPSGSSRSIKIVSPSGSSRSIKIVSPSGSSRSINLLVQVDYDYPLMHTHKKQGEDVVRTL